jgi:hypothetical protein
MDKVQVELELQVAHEWARQGNIERTLLHIELAQKYLLEDDRPRMKYWQHDETGRVCRTALQPSERWYEITLRQYHQAAPSASELMSDRSIDA